MAIAPTIFSASLSGMNFPWRPVEHERKNKRLPVLSADYLLAGTFAPLCLASDKPMAMACFLLLTRFPLFPLIKLPFFILCIARLTDFFAPSPYRGIAISFHP
jgi:hypothetical protein